ncbi:MAG: hypothetical protein NPINA01_16120 [Nitrospinaceae bacterium]|nr:MAG: hypothetical protein NPINA01_16120 [Nitrospinaceae bacterium]
MKRILSISFFLIFVFSAPAFAGKDAGCSPPYQPTNIFKLLINYSKTLDYLATASDKCHKPFKQELTELVQSTWMFSQGCKDATFEDFDEAEKKRGEKTISEKAG